MRKTLKPLRRGAVAVEFAFIAPVLLSIVLGLIELTRIYDAQYLLETAAREGARFASMERDGLLQPGETSNSKLVDDIKSFLSSAGIDQDDVDVFVLDHEDPSQTFDLDDPDNDLRLFDVVVAVPYSGVSYTPVSESHDYSLSGAITFRNGIATLSQ